MFDQDQGAMVPCYPRSAIELKTFKFLLFLLKHGIQNWFGKIFDLETLIMGT